MSERWQVEKAEALAAEWKAFSRRYPTVRINTSDISTLCDRVAEVMREANAYADEIEDLKAQLSKAGSPKFAPFAPRKSQP